MAGRTTMLLVLVLAIAATPACRQVLGLEDAKREEAMGAAGGPPGKVESAPTYCEQQPLAGCESCLQACDGAPFGKTCLEGDKCVLALDSYDSCVGSSCGKDEGNQEACTFKLPPLQKACASRCLAECANTKLVSDCAMYCTCMADTCTSELPLDCMAKCKEDSAALTHCRRDHCDLAGLAAAGAKERTMHCHHASGVIDLCEGADDLEQSERNVCLDRKENFWACNADTECCSDVCNNGACDLPP